jgi:hypothetical protein
VFFVHGDPLIAPQNEGSSGYLVEMDRQFIEDIHFFFIGTAKTQSTHPDVNDTTPFANGRQRMVQQVDKLPYIVLVDDQYLREVQPTGR